MSAKTSSLPLQPSRTDTKFPLTACQEPALRLDRLDVLPQADNKREASLHFHAPDRGPSPAHPSASDEKLEFVQHHDQLKLFTLQICARRGLLMAKQGHSVTVISDTSTLVSDLNGD